MRAAVLALVACGRASAPHVVIDVRLSETGATAIEVERGFTDPIERAIAGLPDVASVRSTSAFGGGSIAVEFTRGDAFALTQAVYTAIPLTQLPQGAMPPAVSIAPGPIVLRYLLRDDTRTGAELRAIQDDDLVIRLARLPGVARVDTCGGAVAETQVIVDPRRLAAFGVSLADVRAAAGARVAKLSDLGDVTVSTRRSPMKLRDVSSVESGAAPADCVALADGKLAVEGIVWAQLGADVERVHAGALRELAATRAQPIAVERELLGEVPAGDAWWGRPIDGLAAAADYVVIEVRGQDLHVLAAGVHGDLATTLARAVPGAAVTDADGAEVVIAGADLEQLAAVAGKVAAAARDAGISVGPVDGAATSEHIEVETDRERAAALGVELAAIADAVRATQVGIPAGSIGERPVVVKLAATSFEDVTVLGRDGAVPLTAVVKIVRGLTPRAIVHDGLSRIVRVHAGTRDLDALRRAVSAVALPAGYKLDVRETARVR